MQRAVLVIIRKNAETINRLKIGKSIVLNSYRMSKERAKIYLKSALSEFELYESLSIKDYLKSAYDNMVNALKELED